MFKISIKSHTKDPFEKLAGELAKRLAPAQKSLIKPELRLRCPVLKSVAAILAGFAEDLHCGIGIWLSLEAANLRLVGTPLSFLVESGASFRPTR